MQGRIVVADHVVTRSLDYAKAIEAQEAYDAAQAEGMLTTSGLVVRVAIGSILVAVTLVAANAFMLQWLR